MTRCLIIVTFDPVDYARSFFITTLNNFLVSF